MLFGGQSQKGNLISSSYQSSDFLQWKKASKNLQNFIESEKLNLVKSFKSPRDQRESSIKKEKINLIKSMEDMHLSIKETERTPRENSIKPKQIKLTALLSQRYIKSPQNLGRSSRKQILSFLHKNKKQIGIQAFEQEFIVMKRDLSQQNTCLKELVEILENEVLSYSQTISEKQNKLSDLNTEMQNIKQNLTKQVHQTSQVTEKLSKKIELNKCMEYIIAELNQKVSILLDKNSQLQSIIDEYKIKEEQNLTGTFSESHSLLSVNSSQNQHKSQNQDQSKISSNLIEDLDSRILAEDKLNWSLSGIDMSCFSKNLNKVHEASSSSVWEDHIISSSEILPHQQIDNIILKHQLQINSLKEKLKYYEIQNQMLRRKKEIAQKNTLEIQQLKFRIEKLSEQNKLMQNSKPNKIKPTSESNIFKDTPKSKHSSHKQPDKTIKQLTKQNNSEVKTLVQTESKKTLNQQTETKIFLSTDSQESKLSPKRKSPLHRKFVRRQSRSPKSSSSLDEDSQISLQFSPERI